MMNIIWVTLTSSVVMVFVRQEKRQEERRKERQEKRREEKTAALKRLTSTLVLFKI